MVRPMLAMTVTYARITAAITAATRVRTTVATHLALAPSTPRNVLCAVAIATKTRPPAAMADRKDFFHRMAAQYRQLAEIASNPELKQRLLDTAANYQAKADEHSD